MNISTLDTTKPPTLESTPLLGDKSKTPDALESQAPDTVLYLAYGSNLCRKTFVGRRHGA